PLPTVLCAVLAACLTALALACGWLGRARPRNVVLISVDTLRRGSLRPFRREAAELPNLDAFAHRSVIFETALSPAPWTLPAHASLLTGLYPDRHGATDPRRRIAANLPTIAPSPTSRSAAQRIRPFSCSSRRTPCTTTSGSSPRR